MRRSDREITDIDEIIQVIAQCDVCRLAFNDEEKGVPYILPLNFGYETLSTGETCLYFHGASEGYKYKVMNLNPNASFEMDCLHRLVSNEDKGHCTMEYKSVIGQGIVTKIEEREEKIRILTLLTDNYHEKHFAFNLAAVDRTTVLKLSIKQMTGKQRIVKG